MRGLHIALEGIDGSGLTTHSRILVERLRSMGLDARYYKEPTEGPVGQVIRYFLRGGGGHDLLALLFAADRLWDYRYAEDSIEAHVARGGIAVSDRYKYSSLAYQGSVLGRDWVYCINSRVPDSDVVIYIDIPVDLALERIRERGVREVYENRVSLERIKAEFEAVLEEARGRGVLVYRVPGAVGGKARSIDEVAGDVLEAALDALRRRGLLD